MALLFPDMSTDPSAAASGHRAWMLLHADACVETRPRRDATTAVCETRNGLTIEASCSPAEPPLPTKLFMFCHGARFLEQATVLRTVEDLVLFRGDDGGCFVYRHGGADPRRRPSLERIPRPEPSSGSRHVGLLPRGGDLYTVAALVGSADDRYTLRRFDSEVGSWSSTAASLEAPRRALPVKIPTNARRLNYHTTTTVITLGGEAGTMGWVDLWTGILLCDLLRGDQHNPTIRHLPLPLPMDEITCDNGMGADPGSPVCRRGIAACTKRGKACLKFAELIVASQRLPDDDVETGLPTFKVDGWTITTWSNTRMAGAYEDWEEESTVLGSELKISDAARLKETGLLRRNPSGEGEEAAVDIGLQNLLVSEPKPSLNGEDDVVYLMARKKFMHRKVYALAVDTRNNLLLGVAEFNTGLRSHSSITYHLGAITKYI